MSLPLRPVQVATNSGFCAGPQVFFRAGGWGIEFCCALGGFPIESVPQQVDDLFVFWVDDGLALLLLHRRGWWPLLDAKLGRRLADRT